MSYQVTVMQILLARNVLGQLQRANLPYKDAYAVGKFLRPLIQADDASAPHNVVFDKFQQDHGRPPQLTDLPDILSSVIEIAGEKLSRELFVKAAEAMGGISAGDLMAIEPFLEGEEDG